MRIVMLVLFQIVVCCYSCSSLADASVSSGEIEIKDDDLRATPRDAMRQLLVALSQRDKQFLTNCFDLTPTAIIESLDIQAVINRVPKLLDQHGQLMPLGLISNDPQGTDEFGLDAELEQVGVLKVNGSVQVPILLEYIQAEPDKRRWLIAQQTLAEFAQLDASRSQSKIDYLIPDALLAPHWRGAPLGQWIAAVLLAIIGAIAGWALAKLISFLLIKIEPLQKFTRVNLVLRSLIAPVGLTAAVVFFVMLERFLEISILIRQDLAIITLSVIWIALFIFIWSLIDNLTSRGEDMLRKHNRAGELSIVVFLRASLKVIIIAVAFILVLGSNGVDVTTGLAALGIGGIALAFGAQKAIENFIGSIVIVTDQPIRVGDFCRIGEVLGTVESLGLRSTRVRTLDDTLVTFPNGLLASERIENYTLRRKFLFRATLNLRYETKLKDLKDLLADARSWLEEADFISNDKLRVRFVGYGAASLDVEIFCYVFAEDYEKFLALQEVILFEIGEFVPKYNSGFAFPSQTLYLTKDRFDKR